ncbi:MAG: hypothetical protein SCARUB_05197 [Candidatus Scalindua rubra]|uniref:Uncharacterized protein n=1 Tax=Candidatus Scalindua rubra TaxID=1872076 RepID=A0A1E3X2A1_9BACT|nr:MAG: hypothetical protein SCARUB_05197 [Candidatus Scalindua rubra]
MDITVLLVLSGFIAYAIDGLLWGLAGNILFRYIGGNQDKWPVGAFFTWLAYFIWDEIFMNQIMGNIGLSIDNQEVIEFIGEDIFSFDIFDIAISIGVIFGGFKLAQKIIVHVFFNNQNKEIMK